MFTGIIETLGTISDIRQNNLNLEITIDSSITPELKIDQSVSHNGICLTVVAISGTQYSVTAINETIQKTNIGNWNQNDLVNLERGMRLGDRLDGHIVQGHIDQTAVCRSVSDENGSWLFTFEYDDAAGNITIEKGSITINGVSLTVVDSQDNAFSVAIIPYTYDNTSFRNIQVGSVVNVEFDVVGKYIARMYSKRT